MNNLLFPNSHNLQIVLKGSDLNDYAKYLSLGIELAGAMIIPLLGGYYADQYFETGKMWTLVGALLGFMGVFWNIYKIAKDANKKSQKDE